MPFAPLLLAFIGLALAPAQAPAAGPAASVATPVTVQLSTVCSFPDVLGDQRVRVPRVEVKRILGPRLVVVGVPRIIGIDRTYRPTFQRYDRLIVLLPAAVQLRRGQLIDVTGAVRTVAGARAAGVRLDEQVTDKNARKHLQWATNKSLVLADSASTEDGVLVAGAR